MPHDLDFKSQAPDRFLALDYLPITPDAQRLGQLLAAALPSKRKYARRGKRQIAFENAAGAFVADLLKAARVDPERWSYRSLNAGSFSRKTVTYRTYRQLFDGARSAHLIEHRKGHYDRYDFGDVKAGAGQAARLRATPALVTLAASCGITPANVDDHFGREVKIEPVVLKSSSHRQGRSKVAGREMRFDETRKTRQYRADVTSLDRFLKKQVIEGGTHLGYRRIFNQGDLPDHDWSKGGRLFSATDDCYQQLPKEKRLLMRINGEPVVEIDIGASFITILHAIRRVPFDVSSDPYAVPGLPRDVVKGWVTMTLGQKRFPTRWSSGDKIEELRAKYALSKEYPVRSVKPRVLDALPVLRDWPDQSTTIFDLMFTESRAIIWAMLRLMEQSIPSLSMHDGLIVPASAERLSGNMLSHAYEEIVGLRPRIMINTMGKRPYAHMAAD